MKRPESHPVTVEWFRVVIKTLVMKRTQTGLSDASKIIQIRCEVTEKTGFATHIKIPAPPTSPGRATPPLPQRSSLPCHWPHRGPAPNVPQTARMARASSELPHQVRGTKSCIGECFLDAYRDDLPPTRNDCRGGPPRQSFTWQPELCL